LSCPDIARLRHIEVDYDKSRTGSLDTFERMQAAAPGDDFPNDLFRNTTRVLHAFPHLST
jgi:hypothetical protein